MLGTPLALLGAYATLNSILAFMVWRTLGLRSDAWSIVRVFIAKRPVGLPYPAR
jgi:hypothetical protein